MSPEQERKEIDLIEWGKFTEVVRQLKESIGELKEDFSELRRSVGSRCSDCVLRHDMDEIKKTVDGHSTRLRKLELRVAAAAAVATLVMQIAFKFFF